MYILVLSDLHLGRGRYFKNGQQNIFEDFTEDERFVEFLEFYSSGKYYLSEIDLVLNGDILDLLQIDVDGIFNHVVDENLTIEAIKAIYKGHSLFFKGLRSFLAKPNKKIIYIIGNHDQAMAFKAAQKFFIELIGANVEFKFNYNEYGVYVEHGHRFDAANSVKEKDYFIKGPGGKKIINLPWASLYCVDVMPKLKKERPYIDKIRPLSKYVKWCLLHDFTFFCKMLFLSAKYVTVWKSSEFSTMNSGLKNTFKLLKRFTLYPKLSKIAKKLFKLNSDCHTLVMGHVHLTAWRRFPGNKYYFNSGTWTIIPSFDVAQHENVAKLTYILVDIHGSTGTRRAASMNVWHGKWCPFKEEISSQF